MFDTVIKKYNVPAITNGNGITEGNITNLPGQINIPRPTRAEIAPEAPTPIVSGENKNGIKVTKFPIIPPKK